MFCPIPFGPLLHDLTSFSLSASSPPREKHRLAARLYARHIALLDAISRSHFSGRANAAARALLDAAMRDAAFASSAKRRGGEEGEGEGEDGEDGEEEELMLYVVQVWVEQAAWMHEGDGRLLGRVLDWVLGMGGQEKARFLDACQEERGVEASLLF